MIELNLKKDLALSFPLSLRSAGDLCYRLKRISQSGDRADPLSHCLIGCLDSLLTQPLSSTPVHPYGFPVWLRRHLAVTSLCCENGVHVVSFFCSYLS